MFLNENVNEKKGFTSKNLRANIMATRGGKQNILKSR